MPTVSVVIPVYNGERFLADAVESALAQTVAPLEILVVDDGSTDGTREVARGFGDRIKLLTQTNQGPAAARNWGVSVAVGDFIALLDADDVMTGDRLQRQLAVVERQSDVDLVLGQQWMFHHGEPLRIDLTLPNVRERLRPGLAPSAALVRRSLFDEVGMFPVDRKIGDFIAWYREVQQRGRRMEVVPHPVFLRRMHDANLSKTHAAEYALLVKQLRGPRDQARKPA